MSSSSTISRTSPLVRWAQETFSRQSFVAAIKTLLWLAPLTLLIWVYAERSQVVTSPAPGETIPIEVRSSDPTHFYVRLMMAEDDRNVLAQLQGPQGRIEDVIRDIAPQNNNPSVILTIDANQAGIRDLDASKELTLSRIFLNKNVAAINCKPSTLKVSIEEMVEDEAEIQLRNEQQAFVASATFSPAKVKFRAPFKDLSDAKAAGPLVVYADLDNNLLRQPGAHADVPVRITSELFKKNGVTYSGETIKATVEIRQSETSGIIKSVPIYELGPMELLNAYRVQSTDNIKVLSNVPIVGQKDKVEALVNGAEPRPYAILPVSSLAVDKNTEGTLELRIDPAVRVDPNYTLKKFWYKLVDKNAP